MIEDMWKNCLNWYNNGWTNSVKKLIYIVLVVFPQYSIAQQSNNGNGHTILPDFSKEVKTNKIQGNTFTTDQFGNYYDIGDTEIRKYDKNGTLMSSYSNQVLGMIAHVDLFNPYKILVYYRDFTKVLVLDNFLTETTEVIDLITLDLDETTLVCRSYNDAMWYYDPVRFELIRKNNELVTTNNSGNIANLLGKNIQPNYLLEYNNYVYLNDTTHGILVFDIYGTYIKTIPIYGIETFEVKDKYIIYSNANKKIEIYNFMAIEKQPYKPDTYKDVIEVRQENELIYILNSKKELIIEKLQE